MAGGSWVMTYLPMSMWTLVWKLALRPWIHMTLGFGGRAVGAGVVLVAGVEDHAVELEEDKA